MVQGEPSGRWLVFRRPNGTHSNFELHQNSARYNAFEFRVSFGVFSVPPPKLVSTPHSYRLTSDEESVHKVLKGRARTPVFLQEH